MVRIAVGFVLVDFTALTVVAVERYGYVGFFRTLFSTLVGAQILVDLSIALSLVLYWMWRDARRRNASFLPYAALTLTFGSVGPLVYLLRHPEARHL